MVHKHFDHCYLINLDERFDRLARVKSNCSMIGLEFERFPAVHYSSIKNFKPNPNLNQFTIKHWSPGAVALIRTTINLIEDAKKRGFKSILVLEDDVEFDIEINKIFEKNIKHIPDDWEMIQFGGLHSKPYEKITNELIKLGGAECLHCYAIHERIYDFLLEILKEEEKPLDHYTAHHVHARGKSFGFIPNLASQYISFSNIVGEVVNYECLKWGQDSIDDRIERFLEEEKKNQI